MRKRAHRRSGIMVAMTLVCLIVVALLGAVLVRALLVQHQQSLRHQHQLQAQWLAESAVHRAVAQLDLPSEYAGETWKVDPQSVGGRWSGAAVIRVETVEADERIRRIEIEARYPEDPERRVIHRREVLMKLPISGDTS